MSTPEWYRNGSYAGHLLHTISFILVHLLAPAISVAISCAQASPDNTSAELPLISLISAPKTLVC